MDSKDNSRLESYMRDPSGKLAFVMGAEDPKATAPEFMMVIYGDEMIARLEFDEAWYLADFLYEHLPPRNKAGLS